MKITAPPLVGVVLIGGQSSRMGTDKSGIDYHGLPQRQHLFDLLSGFCVKTVLSCSDEQARHMADLPFITDLSPGQGPMGGLLSVFKSFPESALITVPCDLPWLDRQTIGHLIEKRNPAKIATTYWNEERQKIEPLLTLWEPAAYPILLDNSKRGFFGPVRALQNENIEIVSPLRIESFQNVNTREEYEVAKLLRSLHIPEDPK